MDAGYITDGTGKRRGVILEIARYTRFPKVLEVHESLHPECQSYLGMVTRGNI